MKSRLWIKWFFVTFLCLMIVNNLLFAQSSTANKVSVIKKSEGIFVIRGFLCNITACDGPDGLLVIDTGYKPERLDSVLSTISNHPVKYILNTNFHSDHIGDNRRLCDKGATIIAHQKTREVLASGWNNPPSAATPPESFEYLPKICFNDTLELYFNDNTIQAIHYPSAHSGGDAIYCFRNKNIIHVGDIFARYAFPFIDSSYGGTITGMINAADHILKLCDDKTILVPGHGEISDRQGLLAYRDKLVESKTLIAKFVKEGKPLDEIIGLEQIRHLYQGGDPMYKTFFVTTVYNELKK